LRWPQVRYQHSHFCAWMNRYNSICSQLFSFHFHQCLH
jgi:hypothetical protein